MSVGVNTDGNDMFSSDNGWAAGVRTESGSDFFLGSGVKLSLENDNDLATGGEHSGGLGNFLASGVRTESCSDNCWAAGVKHLGHASSSTFCKKISTSFFQKCVKCLNQN